MTGSRRSAAEQGRAWASSVALVGSNLVPLFGVVFRQWDLATIVLTYWLENVVVGIFNVLRMAVARGGMVPRGDHYSVEAFPDGLPSRVGTILFFVVHYGGFTLVHGVFVIMLFGTDALSQLAQQGALGGTVHVHSTPAALGSLIPRLEVMFALLAVSHGVSFVHNFLRGGEYKRTSVRDLFLQPYSRIVVLHLTVLLGAFAVILTRSAQAPIALLVVLKTGVDLAAHRRERRKFAQLRVEMTGERG